MAQPRRALLLIAALAAALLLAAAPVNGEFPPGYDRSRPARKPGTCNDTVLGTGVAAGDTCSIQDLQ